jgi:dihydrofolate synthase / folylpolyglutamate synthase
MDGPGKALPGDDPRWQAFIERLYGVARSGVKLGLERIESLLDDLGHPQRGLECIHIAGSNGKGSTASFAASILASSGRSVGLFTSPHLVELTERIAFLDATGRRDIERSTLIEMVARVEAVRPEFEEISFFEIITAAALLAMHDRAVDAGVIEAGLGARLDATRLVHAPVAVLTNVSLEHTRILGETLGAIAREKAAVIRPGCPVVTTTGPSVVDELVDQVAKAADAPVFRLGRDFHIVEARPGRWSLQLADREIDDLSLALLGDHQAQNAALAAQASVLFQPTLGDEAVRRGLQTASWPGRMELFERPGGPRLVLDGAHNPAAVDALAQGLLSNRRGIPGPVHLVLGVLGDKDVPQMMAPLRGLVHSVVLTPIDAPRAADPRAVAAKIPPDFCPLVTVAEGPAAALRTAEERAVEGGGSIVVCGSLYLIGAVRAELAANFRPVLP